jgi:transcriptional regulator with XRE-family HTH domain
VKPLKHRLGEVVRTRRAPDSQETFAARVGVHRTYMGMVERGRINVSLDNLELIAAALGMRLSTLLREAEDLPEDPPTPPLEETAPGAAPGGVGASDGLGGDAPNAAGERMARHARRLRQVAQRAAGGPAPSTPAAPPQP